MKKVLLSLLFIILAFLLLSALYFSISKCGVWPFRCSDYPVPNGLTTKKITVGNGPEDMALDTSSGYPRIIVSCDDRRDKEAQKVPFYGINPATQQSFEFTMIPSNLDIHPHGIDIVTMDSVAYLYAISHNQEGEKWRHPVYRFEIKGDSLLWDKENVFENPLMSVPNDLDVLADGSFYATNYVPNMNPNESTKGIIGIKNGSIVHYDGQGNWKIAAKDFCYPNGIYINENENLLYVANGACHEVLRFKIENGVLNSPESTLQHGQKITIGDNLLMDNKGRLWTTTHPCPLDFLAHAENGEKTSPSQVFAINPATLKTNMVFQNNGELISAASTALYLDNRLYVSQVFEPFVLVVEGSNL